MKAKTIEKILRGQFANFLKTIKDEEVKNLVKKNSIITGGAIVSLLLDEKINDFDLYFTNKETTLKVAQYYVNLLKDQDISFEMIKVVEDGDRIKIRIPSIGIKKIEPKGKFYPVVITDNAISLTNQTQIIIRFYGNPAEIHKNFDFVHVMSYWTSDDGKLHLNPDSIEAILTKELRYYGSLYPVASLFRLRKFLSRGWTITAGDIFKMAFQVSKLDMTNPEVIYDQLIGVDIHYFMSMISRIQEDLKSGKIKEVTQDYLSDLVDEIFHQSDEYKVNENIPDEEPDGNDMG